MLQCLYQLLERFECENTVVLQVVSSLECFQSRSRGRFVPVNWDGQIPKKREALLNCENKFSRCRTRHHPTAATSVIALKVGRWVTCRNSTGIRVVVAGEGIVIVRVPVRAAPGVGCHVRSIFTRVAPDSHLSI